MRTGSGLPSHPGTLGTPRAWSTVGAMSSSRASIGCTSLPRGARSVPQPVLIAEVLPPSTTAHDFETKLPDDQRMPSVREVILVASEERRVEIWQRVGTTWRHEVSTGDAAVAVEAIGGSIPLAEISANLAL